MNTPPAPAPAEADAGLFQSAERWLSGWLQTSSAAEAPADPMPAASRAPAPAPAHAPAPAPARTRGPPPPEALPPPARQHAQPPRVPSKAAAVLAGAPGDHGRAGAGTSGKARSNAGLAHKLQGIMHARSRGAPRAAAHGAAAMLTFRPRYWIDPSGSFRIAIDLLIAMLNELLG